MSRSGAEVEKACAVQSSLRTAASALEKVMAGLAYHAARLGRTRLRAARLVAQSVTGENRASGSVQRLILLAKSSGGGWHGHKPDEGGLACSRAWCACEPGAKAAEVHGGSREHVLQVGFGEPEVAGTAQVHGPHTQ